MEKTDNLALKMDYSAWIMEVHWWYYGGIKKAQLTQPQASRRVFQRKYLLRGWRILKRKAFQAEWAAYGKASTYVRTGLPGAVVCPWTQVLWQKQWEIAQDVGIIIRTLWQMWWRWYKQQIRTKEVAVNFSWGQWQLDSVWRVNRS